MLNLVDDLVVNLNTHLRLGRAKGFDLSAGVEPGTCAKCGTGVFKLENKACYLPGRRIRSWSCHGWRTKSCLWIFGAHKSLFQGLCLKWRCEQHGKFLHCATERGNLIKFCVR